MKWRENPETVRPMLATLAEPPLDEPGPGLRAEVRRHPRPSSTCGPARRPRQRPHLVPPRQRKDLAVPLDRACAETAARRRCAAPLLLDGEIVALDGRAARPASSGCRDGSTSPSARDVAAIDKAQPVALIAFDLLRDGRRDLRGLPLTERRARLEARHRRARVSATLRISEQVAATDARSMRAPGRKAGKD